MSSNNIDFLYKSSIMRSIEEEMINNSDPSIVDLNENPEGYLLLKRSLCKLTTEYQFYEAPESALGFREMAMLKYMAGGELHTDFISFKNCRSEDEINRLISCCKCTCTAWIEVSPQNGFEKIIAISLNNNYN